MIGASCGDNDRMVLVLDNHTSKVISSCVRATELINNGILAIESINCKRESLPDFGAIYFLDPNADSAQRLIDDFKDKPQYKEAHVYFTRAIPDAVMDLFNGQKIVRRSKCLVELNVDFTAREDRIFTMSRPNTIPTLFWSSDKDTFNAEVLRTARQLVSLCVTLSDDPAIRYDGNSKIAKILAKTFDQQLNFTKETARWHGKTHGCVLIVDRAADILTPLMHEFTYQALVHDVAGNNGELCYVGVEEWASLSAEERAKRTMILNEGEDALWAEHRHEHIGNVMSGIPAQLRKFKKENKLAQWEDDRSKARASGGKEKDISVKDMAAALKDFNKYTAMITKFSQHTNLSAECMKKIDSRLLKEVGDLEQDCTTGYDEQGDAINAKKAKTSLISLCQNSKLGAEERLRLVLIYMLSQGGVQASTRRELMRGIPEQCLGVVHGIEKMGQQISDERFKPAAFDAARRKEGLRRVENIVLLRHVPLLWKLAKDLADDSLSVADYPYVGDKQRDEIGSGSSQRVRRRGKDKASRSAEPSEPHLIVFVAGGLTYSEARECYALADKLKINLIFGGSDLISAREFMASVSDTTVPQWTGAVGNALGALPSELLGRSAAAAAPAPAAKTAAADKSGSRRAAEPEPEPRGRKYEAPEEKKKPKRRAADSDDDSDIEAPDF
jgi:hypothetical protein